ncbi:hypothetical protein L580_3514 [Serratia fonticola AU-P3(3)]|nr:hypothetical protein L580_3514 [Serratia fonticola AU-P3(3)]
MPCSFCIDMDGRAIERDDFDVLEDSSETHELIARALGQKKECQISPLLQQQWMN